VWRRLMDTNGDGPLETISRLLHVSTRIMNDDTYLARSHDGFGVVHGRIRRLQPVAEPHLLWGVWPHCELPSPMRTPVYHQPLHASVPLSFWTSAFFLANRQVAREKGEGRSEASCLSSIPSGAPRWSARR
jgi:hypothetical protein